MNLENEDFGDIQNLRMTAPVGDEAQSINLGNGTMFQRMPDGTAQIVPIQLPPEQPEADFYGNIIEEVDPDEILQISRTLKELVEADNESQIPYRKAMADFIELLGLDLTRSSEEADTDSATVDLYSGAAYEALTHAVAVALPNVLPTNGKIKTCIYGAPTEELENVGERQDKFYLFFFKEKCKDFRKEQIKTLMWSYAGGDATKKVCIDPIRNHPTSYFIPPEDFIVHIDYSSYLSAPRQTHIIRLTKREFDISVKGGFYSNKFAPPPVESLRGDDGEVSEIREALDRTSGVDPNNSDDGRELKGYIQAECHTHLQIKSDRKNNTGLPLSYILTFDQQTGAPTRLVRNWVRTDPFKQYQEYFVKYTTFPALQGEGWGMIHYASTPAKASTALQRLIIKSAVYQSWPGGMYSEGISLQNNTLTPQPGQWSPIATGGMPISQAIQAIPSPGPSPVLPETVNNLDDRIRRPTDMINDTISEMAPRAPTGSVLAVLETLQKVPTFVMQGFYESFSRELELFRQRFYEWLPDNEPYPFHVVGGEHIVMKEDFSPRFTIVPTADPTLQSSTYRMMMSELLLSKANEAPDLHNRRNVYENFYKTMNVPDDIIDKILLPTPPTPEELKPVDPVTENADLIQGKPVKAFIFQDHQAHMSVHQGILGDPNVDPNVAAATQAHMKEHEAMAYVLDIQARMGQPIPENISELPPEVQNQIAQMEAQAALQKQQEEQAQNPPPPQPVDPGTAMLEDARLKAETAQQKNALDAEKAQQDFQLKMAQMELDKAKFEVESEQKDRDINLREIDLQIRAELEGLKVDISRNKVERDSALKEKDLEIKQQKKLEDIIKSQAEDQAMLINDVGENV